MIDVQTQYSKIQSYAVYLVGPVNNELPKQLETITEKLYWL